MTFIEQVKTLISRGEIQEASTNFIEDILNAILGDSVSVGKIMIAIAKTPFFVREQLFWTKMEAFLDGVYLTSDDKMKLSAKLVENGEKNDNMYRLVECIDRAETQKKIRYLINATRSLLLDFIDSTTYFRICHSITHTLEEDLQFLREHIAECDLAYSPCTQGLLMAGLMYQSVIDGNGDQKYSFTPTAKMVDKFAVSYDDRDRYSDTKIISDLEAVPQIRIPSTEWEEISNDDIEKLF